MTRPDLPPQAPETALRRARERQVELLDAVVEPAYHRLLTATERLEDAQRRYDEAKARYDELAAEQADVQSALAEEDSVLE